MAATSGTAFFAPSIADLIVECFARLQLYAPALQTEHLVEARRSANLILTDWSANRGVNLWAVEPIHIGLEAGRASYFLPDDTIQLLDVYLRVYDMDLQTQEPTAIGNALIPMTAGGVPIISTFGDPAIIAPGSGTLSSLTGSQAIGLRWVAHGLRQGDALFFPYIASVGGLAITGLYVVDFVVDSDTILFNARDPAVETQSLQGATPLLQSQNGNEQIIVVYPNHGKSVGDTFNVWSDTTVGGLTLSGEYEIAFVLTPYQFIVLADGSASSNDAAFIDNGHITVIRETGGLDYMDRTMTGISRSEYAAMPQKYQTGTTNTFWFDRIIPATVSVWPVPTVTDNFGLIAYRMRQLQDMVPVSGQTPDMPNRFLPAFTAELTAALAEKFKPELFAAKAAIALATWPRAAQEDRELVPFFITPGMSGYFR